MFKSGFLKRSADLKQAELVHRNDVHPGFFLKVGNETRTIHLHAYGSKMLVFLGGGGGGTRE